MKVFYELNLKVRVPVLPEDAECEAILSAIENDASTPACNYYPRNSVDFNYPQSVECHR